MDGRVHFVRHGLVPHDEGCPFHDPDLSTRLSALKSGSDTQARPVTPYEGDLLTLKEVGLSRAARSSPSRTGVDRRHGGTLPSVGRILLTWVEQSGINLLTSEELVSRKDRPVMARDPSAQYRKLTGLWGSLATHEIALSEILCQYPSVVSRFLARFRSLESRFPEGVRPQGFVCFVVDSVEQTPGGWDIKVETRKGEYCGRVFGRVSLVGQAAGGPFLFIGKVAKVAESGRYEITSGYAHPVFSKSLPFPVDSEFERGVGAVLLEQVCYWSQVHSVETQFRKPLFDEQIGDYWLRPDFELWLDNGWRIVVEALGFPDDEAYMRRKAEMESLLRSLEKTDVVTWSYDDQGQESHLRRILTAKALSLSDQGSQAG
jgi:hypothetical protein